MLPTIFGLRLPGMEAVKLLAVAPAAVLALLAPDSAAAMQRCPDHAKVAEHLEKRYAETVISLGLTSNGRLVQVFSSEDGSTWTIVATTPEGTSCVVASGTHWQKAPEAADPLA